MQQNFFLGHNPFGFHRVAYTEWGPAAAPVAVCVHGLTRNGRDFDRLADALQKNHRVFCPDVAGRGKSDWLKDPGLYAYPQYISDMTVLIARTGSAEVDWVGTSMGGIIGMLLAASENSPLRKLVINDVGPELSLDSLKRISGYVGQVPEFADLGEVEKHMRKIYAPFGVSTDADWKAMAEFGSRKLPNGKYALGHDPAIALNFTKLEENVEFWDAYDRIRCPVLLLRGEKSDVLSRETARQMTERGPKANLVELPGVGHAPALTDPEQIGIICEFLDRAS